MLLDSISIKVVILKSLVNFNSIFGAPVYKEFNIETKLDQKFHCYSLTSSDCTRRPILNNGFRLLQKK